MSICNICSIKPSKYRCPTCYNIRYCSLSCYKSHKEICTKNGNGNENPLNIPTTSGNGNTITTPPTTSNIPSSNEYTEILNKLSKDDKITNLDKNITSIISKINKSDTVDAKILELHNSMDNIEFAQFISHLQQYLPQ